MKGVTEKSLTMIIEKKEVVVVYYFLFCFSFAVKFIVTILLIQSVSWYNNCQSCRGVSYLFCLFLERRDVLKLTICTM